MVVFEALKGIFSKRDDDSRKGDFGHVLVLGGSLLYTGAPALSGLAALRSGCDLATIAAPKRAADVIATYSPSLIAYPLVGDCISENHEKIIQGLLRRCDSVCVGNGAGRDGQTLDFFSKFFSRLKKPMVIDADGVYAIKRKLNECVVTPHAREFEVFSGLSLSKDFDERVSQVAKTAKRFGCTVLLKGHFDIISDGSRTEVNQTGNPFMSVGGTGDVLAGVVASLLSQGMEPFEAALLGANLNGVAGDLAAWEKKNGLLPTDVIEKLPDAIKSL